MQSRLYLSRLGQPILHRASSIPILQSFKNTCPLFRNINHKCLYTTQVEGRPKGGVGLQDVPSIQNDAGRPFLTPSKALSTFLDSSSDATRNAYWESVKHDLNWRTLHSIILHRLNNTEHSTSQHRTLAKHGFTSEDVDTWCKILLEDGADERVHLYLSTPAIMPLGLLLQICRGDTLQVHTLELLLVRVWDLVRYSPSPISRQAQSDEVGKILTPSLDIGSVDEPIFGDDRDGYESSSSSTITECIEGTAFSLLISRLLRLCRNIWPEAMVTVARLVPIYIDKLPIKFQDRKTPSPKLYRHICALQSIVLRALALPARARPYHNMVHNWAAQKIILDFSTSFSPPLLLDQSAYQAVIQVLNSMKKSPAESKSSARRARSWPPWRIDLDGMDAIRDPEEDKSRVVKALEAKREAGYSDTQYDRTMSILGGQEPDRTPTIQSRFVKKNRQRIGFDETSRDVGLGRDIWAVRIRCTRDVQEAWTAFAHFLKQGGAPGTQIYFSMFEKMIYERKRIGIQNVDKIGSGDGLEVLPVVDDNVSDFYKSRLKPPTLNELYEDMMRRKIRPRRKLLTLLVRHAVSIEQCLGYLKDAGIKKDILRLLVCRRPPTETGRNALVRAFEHSSKAHILTDFIYLLCRFTPRAVQVPIHSPNQSQYLESSDPDSVWIIRSTYNYLDSPERHLQQAVWLLLSWQPRHRPPWYTLLKSLSQLNTIIDTAKFGDPKQYQTAWEMTAIILKQFQDIGLELDPDGFQIIGDTFTKFATVAPQSPDMTTSVADATQIIKAEVRKLARDNEGSEILPKLKFPMHGAAMHAYIRAMASVKDYREIILALKWMREHDEDLLMIADRSKGGVNLLHRSLVAIRVACEGASYSYRLAARRYLTKKGSRWIRWPSDEDVDEYQRNYQPTYLEDHFNAKMRKADRHSGDTETIHDVKTQVEHDEK